MLLARAARTHTHRHLSVCETKPNRVGYLSATVFECARMCVRWWCCIRQMPIVNWNASPISIDQNPNWKIKCLTYSLFHWVHAVWLVSCVATVLLCAAAFIHCPSSYGLTFRLQEVTTVRKISRNLNQSQKYWCTGYALITLKSECNRERQKERERAPPSNPVSNADDHRHREIDYMYLCIIYMQIMDINHFAKCEQSDWPPDTVDSRHTSNTCHNDCINNTMTEENATN